jgi:calcium-dependent protein kinase
MGCSSSKPKPRTSTTNKKPESMPLTPQPSEKTEARSLEIKAGQFVQLLTEPIYKQYNIVKQLGSGSFGKVYLAEHKVSNEKRAIKELEKSLVDVCPGQSKFFSEVAILSKLDHPNILKVYELFQDTRRYYMVTEACEKGELFDYLVQSQRLTEHVAAHIMYQLFSAVCFCHEQGIVHRDLKPENLLIDSIASNGEVFIKVIDFGTSTLFTKETKLRARLGTPYYIAPEVLNMEYDEKCDLWSCGVILYILLSGSPPFGGTSDQEIMNVIRVGAFAFPSNVWAQVSEDAKSLISRLLKMNPGERPSAKECLKDPWLVRYHAKSLSNLGSNQGSLENLRGFHTGEHLRQAFMSFIVAQLLSKDQTAVLRREFQSMDEDGDGRLSREELLLGYSRHMPEEKAIEVVKHVMNTVDTDGNGFIEYSEFIAAAINLETLLSKNTLEAAFNACDRDHSGSLSKSELEELLGGGKAENEQVWVKLIEEADRNGDGEIDLKEFTSLMLHSSIG